jgi:glycosyltransferase involved in cell wall biosynthesis
VRVLVVLGRASGGIGAHVDGLVGGVRAAGHEVVVVTDRSTASTFGWADALALWPVHPGWRAPRGLLDWHRIMRLAGTADIVHAHGHQAAVVAGVAVARARPRPRLVVSLHNDLPPGPAAAPMERLVGRVLRRADLVTGASADLVALAARLGAGSTELATVASPMVDELLDAEPLSGPARADLLAAAGVDPARPLVVSVSRIAPQKDLTTLVAAARRSRCGATWVVIGAGDDDLRARLERSAGGIPDEAATVRFLGARRDVAAWLGAADVFVLTSRWEARALVVQEAMAAGVAVVATDTGGLPGLVGDGGLLAPVGDAAAVAAHVDRILSDRGLRRRLGAAGRAAAASWDRPAGEARRWIERYAAALRR